MIQIGAWFGQRWRAIGLKQSPLLADVQDAPGTWWRLPVGFACGLVASVAVLIVVMVILGVGLMISLGPARTADLARAMQDYIKGGTAPGFAASLVILPLLSVVNGATALITVLVASLVTQRRFRLSFTTAPRWRWGQLFLGLGLNVLLLAPLMAFDVLRGGTPAKFPLFTLTHSPGEMAAYLAVAIVCLIVAAGAEELVFRGWFLRHSAALLRLTVLFLPLNGLLFSAAHGDFDVNAYIDRTCAGIGLAYMALRLGGIEFSTGAHAANNLLIVLFIEPLSLVTPPPTPFDWVSLLESVAGIAIAVLATELALGWPVLRRWMGPSYSPREGAAAVF